MGKVFGAFVPAFFLAGAIGSWIPKSAVIRYLSPTAPRHVAYGMATMAGGLLSVCACGILPLFAAIYSRGAGIGPAMTFLFAGPAINLIAIYYTFDVLGPSIGVARILSVLVLSVLVGLVFDFVMGDARPAEEEVPAARKNAIDLGADDGRAGWQTAFPMVFMALATIILPLKIRGGGRLFGMASGLDDARSGLLLKLGLVAVCVALVVWSTRRWFDAEERAAWLGKTWELLKKIVPKIVIGIFLTGVLEQYVGRGEIVARVGSNTVGANFLASVAGGVLYFGTIVGVVVARAFQVMGMADGPLLALLIAGPSVTLPSVLAINGIIGVRRSLAYFALVVLVAMAAGLLFGSLGGTALTLAD